MTFIIYVTGTAKVPVADCNIKHFNSQEKEIFIFKDYIKEFKNHIYGQTKKCLYLKVCDLIMIWSTILKVIENYFI